MITFNNSLFVWKGRFEDRFIPKKAGFKWVEKQWSTPSPYVAYLLIKGADDKAKAQLKRVDDAVFLSERKEETLVIRDIPVPDGLALMPFQVAGIDNLVRQMESGRKAVGLFDEQGLGKTVQAIGVANVLGYKRLLVICPASLRLNWVVELNKWHFHNNEAVAILSGRDKVVPDKSCVVSYDLSERVKDYEPDLVIVDEVHFVKNASTKRSKLVLGSARGKWKGFVSKAPSIFLSGTPIPNGKPNEIHPVLFKSAPEIIDYMNYWTFLDHFCTVSRYDDMEKITGAKNKPELFARLRGSGFMTRRLKKDVLKDLPDKQYKMILLQENSAIRKVLEKEKDFSAEDIMKHGVPVGTALPKIRREMGEAKLPLAVNYIKDVLDGGVEKVVVFAHHTSVNEGLFEALKAYNPVIITGKVSAVNRQERVVAFQNDPAVRVFIGNIQAAGTGLTLTASSDVIFVESSWVPGENEQASDRCHRIGQKGNVMIHSLVVVGSIDATIMGAAATKAVDSKHILQGE